MITNFQSPNLQREIIRKIEKLFFKFSPIDLLIILYQLTKFEAPSCYSLRYHDYKFSKSKSAKGDNSKKIEKLFFKFSPIDLLIILYQLTKFEAPSCYSLRYHDYKFSKSKSAKGDNTKKIEKLFFKFSPIDLLIILYQLTKFEAPSCNTFRDIMIKNFQSPNLQREIIRKKKKITFLKFSPIDLLIILYCPKIFTLDL